MPRLKEAIDLCQKDFDFYKSMTDRMVTRLSGEALIIDYERNRQFEEVINELKNVNFTDYVLYNTGFKFQIQKGNDIYTFFLYEDYRWKIISETIYAGNDKILSSNISVYHVKNDDDLYRCIANLIIGAPINFNELNRFGG